MILSLKVYINNKLSVKKLQLRSNELGGNMGFNIYGRNVKEARRRDSYTLRLLHIYHSNISVKFVGR